MTTPKKPRRKPFLLVTILVVLIIIGGFLGYKWYKNHLASNVTDQTAYLYIPTGSTFEDLMKNLEENAVLKDTSSFRWVAEKKEYPQNIKAGRYALKEGMNNTDLVKMLGAGLQEPVKLRFQDLRLRGDFAKYIATQIEPDSTSIMNLLNNDSLAHSYGFNLDEFYSMFIPNTYEFWWNTSAEGFFKKMNTEYEKFWNEERMKKAQDINLSPKEVSALAAIVKGEALHNDEMPQIAGLYLNRIRKGILLQADPTVIFATQDFSIRRVLNKHLTTPSPYNTYVNAGLPPGPITMPSIASIDAVLNAKSHNYIYMCAKDDFSGYHNFAVSMSEHLINARKFQKALDKRNIKK